jgi:hypothetical protein
MIGTLDLTAELAPDAGARPGRLRARTLHVASIVALIGLVAVGGNLASTIAGPWGATPWSAARAGASSGAPEGTADHDGRVSEGGARHVPPTLSHADLLAHVRGVGARSGMELRELTVSADPSTGRRTMLLRLDVESTGPDAVAATLRTLEHPALVGLSITTVTPVPAGGRVDVAADVTIDTARTVTAAGESDASIATQLTGLVSSSGARLTALELASVRRDGAVLLVAEGAEPALLRLLQGLESGPTAAPRIRTFQVVRGPDGSAELRLTFTTREGGTDA